MIQSTPLAPTLVFLLALTPAPWNPRTIKDERFANLCRSIEADPEFLNHRPVLAMADGTIYAGNMRYRAAQHLGMETIPAIVEDIPEQLAKERALRDNAQWGVARLEKEAVVRGEPKRAPIFLARDDRARGSVAHRCGDSRRTLRCLRAAAGLLLPQATAPLTASPRSYVDSGPPMESHYFVTVRVAVVV